MAYGSVLTDIVQSSTAGTPPQFNDGNGTQTGTLCRAWLTYNGSSPGAIRASFNISSVTYNSAGTFTVNFTNAMPDTNYAIADATGQRFIQSEVNTTSSTLIVTRDNTGTLVDTANIYQAIFR